jgi:hypothetical protein
MGSFVPFGGFFSTPSESKSPVSSTNSSFTRCDKCNEKYEQEVADFLKVDSATLSSSLPWFKKVVDLDSHGGLDTAKVCYDHQILSNTYCDINMHTHMYATWWGKLLYRSTYII